MIHHELKKSSWLKMKIHTWD